MRSWDAIRLWKKSRVFVASLHCIWNATESMEKTDDEYDYSTTAASKLAKTHITHEMILFEMCIFQIPSDFTFFSYPAWTIQGITTSFDKIFVKARIFRKSFFIKYLLGDPVIYPENIAWQTFSKTFTKVKIFFPDTRWTAKSKLCLYLTSPRIRESSAQPHQAIKFWTLDAPIVATLTDLAIDDRGRDRVIDPDLSIVEPMFKVQVRDSQDPLNSVRVIQQAVSSQMEIPDCSNILHHSQSRLIV